MSVSEVEVTKEEILVAEKVARFIVKTGLVTPAVFFIELHRPFNYFASRFLVMLAPFIQAFLLTNEYDRFVDFLEKRESVDIFLNLIEKADNERKKKIKNKE